MRAGYLSKELMNAALSCRAFAVAVAALWPFAQARAQSASATPSPPASPPAKPPLEPSFDLAPRRATDTVTLSLEKADLPELVRTMSQMTGKQFVFAAAPRSFEATLISQQKVTVAEAYQAFLSILAANHQSFGLPTTSSSAASALSSLATLAAPASVNYAKIGPEIKITPHLNDSDEVRLDIHETISDLTADPPQGTLGTINYVERAAETTLTVKDGHTVVIGGLVRDKLTRTSTKVPLFGDIPLLGLLFRSSKETVEKDNLVLILTPHIIRDEDDMRRIFEERMQERQEFLDHYFVFRDEAPPYFDPSRGSGLLAALRASHRDLEARRLLEDPAPPASPPAHKPRPALDLPSSQLLSPQAAPSPSVQGTSAPRAIERMEK